MTFVDVEFNCSRSKLTFMQKPTGRGGFMIGHVTGMITDDLTHTPHCLITIMPRHPRPWAHIHCSKDPAGTLKRTFLASNVTVTVLVPFGTEKPSSLAVQAKGAESVRFSSTIGGKELSTEPMTLAKEFGAPPSFRSPYASLYLVPPTTVTLAVTLVLEPVGPNLTDVPYRSQPAVRQVQHGGDKSKGPWPA